MNPKLMPVDPCLIKDNVFKLIGADWMLPSGESLPLPNGTAIPSHFQVIEAPAEWSAPSPVEAAYWVLPGVPRFDSAPPTRKYSICLPASFI